MKSKDKSQKATVKSTGPAMWPWVAVVLVLLIFAGIRLRLLDIPLERDEGEYAYAGQLIRDGVAPYKLAYNMKLPGTYAAYAVIMTLFGETIKGIHLGLLFVNAATSVLVFLLARRLFDPKAAVISCASYALLSTSSSVLGLAAHANHFVTLFVVGGLLMLWRALDKGRRQDFFWSGLLFGLAYVMKQPAFVFCAFAGLWLLLAEFRQKPRDTRRLFGRCGLVIFGMAIPFAGTCAILWQAGVFEKFWFWTFSYASTYATTMPLSAVPKILPSAFSLATENNLWMWSLAAIGLVLLPFYKNSRGLSIWLGGLTLFSVVAVSVGFYFRQHYFILLLPALVLLIGGAVKYVSEMLGRRGSGGKLIPASVFAIVFAITLWSQRFVFFQGTPDIVSVVNFGENPFLESVPIAQYIKDNSKPDDTIAVIGSEPQIYFYANRPSATGYIYTYALMEDQPFAKTMQQEMIREIEEAKPEYLVFVGFQFSWATSGNSDSTIFNWYDAYQTNYVPVGIVDFHSPTDRRFRWNEDAASGVQTKSYTQIWRRKTGS